MGRKADAARRAHGGGRVAQRDNGVVDVLAGEQCDDANAVSGDGCEPEARSA